MEILPGDGGAWLDGTAVSQDGFIVTEGHIGIPQKPLYKAYLEAVQSFNYHRGVLDQPESIAPHAVDLIHSSAVLLLADPAHHTAWNTRKRLIQLALLGADSELGFCAALLTVRDCAKQSVLWHHRRWLLRRIFSYPADAEAHFSTCNLPSSLEDEDEDTLRNLNLPLATLQKEFDLCALACNTYERNYFAWAHRYRCLDALLAMLVLESSIRSERAAKLGQMLRDEIDWCNRWLERHASDYSAAQYRCRLATATVHLTALASQSLNLALLGSFEGPEGLWRHAKDLVQAYPDHEALWLYLRGALQIVWQTSGRQSETQYDEVKNWAKNAQALPEDEDEMRDSRDLARWNASRFLAWLDRQPDSL